MKADRLPVWAFHRLTVEQKLALSRLRDGAGCGPGPAERAQRELDRWLENSIPPMGESN